MFRQPNAGWFSSATALGAATSTRKANVVVRRASSSCTTSRPSPVVAATSQQTWAIFCRAHNTLAAEEDFSRKFVQTERDKVPHESWAAQSRRELGQPSRRSTLATDSHHVFAEDCVLKDEPPVHVAQRRSALVQEDCFGAALISLAIRAGADAASPGRAAAPVRCSAASRAGSRESCRGRTLRDQEVIHAQEFLKPDTAR